MPRMPETRDSLLVRLAQPEDHDAWREFLDCYESAILRYTRGHGLQEADAREVVQEVLLLVHQRIPQWKPSGIPGSFRRWLLRVTHQLCLKSLARYAQGRVAAGGTSLHGRLAAVLESEPDPAIAEREWQRWAFDWAAEQVAREVDESTWQAFWWAAVEGWSAADVARRCNLSVGSVYTNKCRVLARIRQRVMDLSRRIEE